MKNTIPLCLQKNDSDKNNNIIVIAKAILTLLVVVIAFQNRRKLARGVQTGWLPLSRVIVYEVLLMGVIVILGSWLSKTEPPVGAEVADSPAIAIVGFPAPAAPNFVRILTVYDPDALMIAILIT